MFKKSQSVPPFYIFRHYVTYRKLQKNFEKKSEFFSQFLIFLRAFVVSSYRKSGFRFRVFLSLRYGADLGRFRFVPNMSESWCFHHNCVIHLAFIKPCAERNKRLFFGISQPLFPKIYTETTYTSARYADLFGRIW